MVKPRVASVASSKQANKQAKQASKEPRRYTEKDQGDQCDQRTAVILVGPAATLQADVEEAEKLLASGD